MKNHEMYFDLSLDLPKRLILKEKMTQKQIKTLDKSCPWGIMIDIALLMFFRF